MDEAILWTRYAVACSQKLLSNSSIITLKSSLNESYEVTRCIKRAKEKQNDREWNNEWSQAEITMYDVARVSVANYHR